VNFDRERVITISIQIEFFGGLIGGPIASLADYYAPPKKGGSGCSLFPSSLALATSFLMVQMANSEKARR
jgi:hypothetical protein